MGINTYMKNILKYYKKHWYLYLISIVIGFYPLVWCCVIIGLSGHTTILSKLTTMMIWIMITTFPFWISNWCFVSSLKKSYNYINRVKYLILSQIISNVPFIAIAVYLVVLFELGYI